MSDLSDIQLRIRVDIINSAAILGLVSNMNKAQSATQKLGDASVQTAKKSSVFVRAFDKVTGHLSGVERAMDAVFRASVHMQAMGRDLLGFAKKVAGAAKTMVDAWGDFEFTLNRATAAADIFGNTSPLYDKVKVAVYGVARELRLFPAEEVAKGLYFWQSTTGEVINTQEQLAATMKNVTSVMKLAAMTNTNYETVIKGVYSVLKQFNLGIGETAHVSELLFFATQKTALELPDLINAFKMTGAVMGNAKEPLTTMVAVLGAIGNAGFRGSQAGRALRQTYIKIVKPTAAAKAALDALFKSQGGYNKVAFDSKGNFIGMEKYVMKLAKATHGLTYEQKAHLLATITTANELPVMTQMLRMADQAIVAGKKSWIDFAVSQVSATEAFNKSWGNLANSWRGVVGGLKQSVQPILLETGRMIAKVLTPTLNELADAFWSAGPAIQAIAQDVVESFKPMVEWVGKVIKGIIDWSRANPKLMKQIAKFGIIAAVISGVAGAILLAAGTFTFLLANMILVIAGMAPLLAVFVAVGAAVALFGTKVYQNVGGIQNSFKNLLAAIMRFVKLFLFGNADAGKSIGDLGKIINDVADKAVTLLAKAFDKIAFALNSLTPEDVATIKKIVGALAALILLNKGLNITHDAINGVAGAFRGLTSAAKAAQGVGTTAIGGVQKAASTAETVVTGAFNAIVIVLARFAPALLAALGPVGVAIAAVVALIVGLVAAYETNFLGFRDFVDGIVSWLVTNVLPPLGAIFSTVAGFITNTLLPAVGGIASYLSSVLTPLFEQLIATGTAFWNFVLLLADAIGGAIGRIMSVFGEVWKYISVVLAAIGIDVSGWSLTLEGIFSALASVVNNIIFPWVAGIFNIIKGVFEGIVSFMTSVFKIIEGIFEVATGILKGNWALVWKGIQNIVNGVLGFITSIITTALGVIEGLIRVGLGIVDGIFKTVFGTGAGSIYSKVVGFIQTITTFGGDLVRGLAKGITDLLGWLWGQVSGFFGSIIDNIKGLLGIKSPSTLMAGIGKNIVKGLWDGILSLKDWIMGKVWDFIRSVIPGPILDALGIKSPSRVMMAIGQNIVLGLAKGIVTTDAATKAMTALASDLAATAASATANIGVSANGVMQIARTTDATKTINLNVDVTSGDGSVNQVDTDTLASLITGSDMVRALERMSTAD